MNQLLSKILRDSRFRSRQFIAPNCNEQELWHLYARYGTPLRGTFPFATYPGLSEDNVNGRLKKLSSRKSNSLLQGIADSFCLLIVTGPLLGDRTKPERKMASRFVLEETCERALQNWPGEIRSLHETLWDDPTMAATTEMIFKYRAHQLLRGETGSSSSPSVANLKLLVVCDDYAATIVQQDAVGAGIPGQRKLSLKTHPTPSRLDVIIVLRADTSLRSTRGFSPGPTLSRPPSFSRSE